MACPLSTLLNARDISPIRNINSGTERRDDLHIPCTPTNTQEDGIIPLTDIVKYATRPATGYRYPVILSHRRGALYRRRAVKFSTRRHDLPTPPHSSPLLGSQDSAHCSDHAQAEPEFDADSGYDSEPPTPELDFTQFSIFKALHAHPELVFELARHLDIDDLISLYAISVDFHKSVDARFTTMIRNQAEARAGESAGIFIFRCYKNLCIRDPAARPLARLPYQARFVPSFRWLRMIVYREHAVNEIINCLAAEGLFLPPQASVAIKKFWFTLDIGDTARRIGLIHNERFWTDQDLFITTMFLIKLDMRLTDPRTGNGELGLRQMLLAQPSLTTLLRALQRRAVRTQLEMVRLFVRWRYRPPPRLAHVSILRVPVHEVGILQYERSGAERRRLAPVDALVARETVRRQMKLEYHIIDMMLYGFIDKQTSLDCWHPGAVIDEEMELDQHFDDEVGGNGAEVGDDGGNDDGGSGDVDVGVGDEGSDVKDHVNDDSAAGTAYGVTDGNNSEESASNTTIAATAGVAAVADMELGTGMDLDVDVDMDMDID